MCKYHGPASNSEDHCVLHEWDVRSSGFFFNWAYCVFLLWEFGIAGLKLSFLEGGLIL